MDSRFQVVRTLGSGSFGAVYEVVDSEGRHFAMKKIKPESTSRYLETEINNHMALVHPHIVQFRESFSTDDGEIVIVMELANGGSLFELIRREKRLPESKARWYFQQLLIAVDFCLKRGVANRDIKLENLLLHTEMGLPQPILKVCDFGYSKAYRRSIPKTRVGTLSYMAPEVIINCSKKQYDAELADIWSCGVVLYVMLYGVYPFDKWSVDKGLSETEKMRRMLERMQAEAYRLYPEVPVSEGCIDMLRGLLKPDPQQRFTVEQILQHPWFLRGLPSMALSMNSVYLDLARARDGECQETTCHVEV